MKPTITTIIPTYNRAHLLRRSIRSVLRQTYQDLELIIIDDGSTDNTREVINSFTDKRIKYIKLEKNMGAAIARNEGIKAAKGRYIAFQDSDDEWLPEKLEKQMDVFQQLSEKVSVVYTDMHRISDKGKKIGYWRSPHLDSCKEDISRTILSSSLIKDYGIGIQSTLIRKECFDKVGYFDKCQPMFIDLEMFIRLSYHFNFFHIKEPLVNFYATDNSITSAKGGNRHISANELIFQKHYNYIKKNKTLLAEYCTWLSERMICSKETFDRGRKYLIIKFLAKPFRSKVFFKMIFSFFGIKFYLKISKIRYKCKRLWNLLLKNGRNDNAQEA